MKNRKKLLKKITLGIAGFVTLSLLLVLGAEAWLGFKIRRAVEKEITTLSGGVFQVKIGLVYVDLISRAVNLNQVSIKSDDALLAEKKHPLKSLNVEIKQLRIKEVHLNKKGDKLLYVGEVGLFYPRITVDFAPGDTSTNPPALFRHDRPGQTEPLFRKIEMNRIRILDGSLKYCEERNDKKQCYSIEGISTQTDNLDLDITTPLQETLLDDDIRISVDYLSYSFDQESMLVEVDTLAIATGKGLLSVGRVRLLPQYSEDEFASLSPDHSDWTQASISGISANGLDYIELLRHKTLRIDSLSVRQVDVSSYKNRKIPQPERVKPIFTESLRKLPYQIDIRRVHLARIDAKYAELAPNGEEPGVITFDEITADFFGLTNIVRPDQPYIKLTAQGRLMAQGAVNAVFRLPVDLQKDRFEVTGQLGSMKMSLLNRIVEPLVGLDIESGQINSMEFSITGNALQSEVHLKLLYDDLSIALMKAKNGHFKERKLLTDILDKLLIRHSNPDGKKLSTGTGITKRNLYRSQFNYLWKSLLPGIKETVIKYNPDHKEIREQRHKHRHP